MLNFSEEEWNAYRKKFNVDNNGKKNKARIKSVEKTSFIQNKISIDKKSQEPSKKMTETEIQNLIRDFLRASGWYVIRHQQSLGSLKGLSDLSAIKNGITIYVEVKTPKGKQSKYQKEFQDNIENHGGLYLLARSVEDTKNFLIKNKL